MEARNLTEQTVIEALDDKIIISKGEYDSLVIGEKNRKLFENAIESGAKLDWSKKDLTFDDTYIKAAYKLIYPLTYEKLLDKKLKEAAEQEQEQE